MVDVVERGCVVARRCRSIFHWFCRLCGWRSSGSEQHHHAGAENVSGQLVKKHQSVCGFLTASLVGLNAGVV